MPLLFPLLVSTLLFAIGVYGVLARRNAILVLMSVELMLNAVNLNLVAFDAWHGDRHHGGQVLTLFVITIAAAEIGLGLAIVLRLFRHRAHVDVDRVRDLADRERAPLAVAADAGHQRGATGPGASVDWDATNDWDASADWDTDDDWVVCDDWVESADRGREGDREDGGGDVDGSGGPSGRPESPSDADGGGPRPAGQPAEPAGSGGHG